VWTTYPEVHQQTTPLMVRGVIAARKDADPTQALHYFQMAQEQLPPSETERLATIDLFAGMTMIDRGTYSEQLADLAPSRLAAFENAKLVGFSQRLLCPSNPTACGKWVAEIVAGAKNPSPGL
ncbi:MAG: hypothetical protein ACE5FP_10000, partial [Gemmatimonadota bacterium]